MSERTALVTGSARRVGRAIAEALVTAGWDVLVHARYGDAAARAARELGAAGSVGADLERSEAIDVIALAVRNAFAGRGLGLLVNSAATFERVDQWQDAGIDGWRRAMSVNARAPYLLTSALVPELAVTNGCVVNVSDHAAHEHWPNFPIHAASKAALESLTRSGARALAHEGIRVNAVSPGTILAPDTWSAERLAQERASGRLDTPAELVRTILDFADDPTRTGEIVVLR